nr:hypothetical protein CFP56_37142 [Quercus suber]
MGPVLLLILCLGFSYHQSQFKHHVDVLLRGIEDLMSTGLISADTSQSVAEISRRRCQRSDACGLVRARLCIATRPLAPSWALKVDAWMVELADPQSTPRRPHPTTSFSPSCWLIRLLREPRLNLHLPSCALPHPHARDISPLELRPAQK